MDIEKEISISILKLTKNGPTTLRFVGKDAKIPQVIAENLIERLYDAGLLYLQNQIVIVNGLERVKLAVRTIQLGADIEHVSSFLDWKQFEAIAAIAFERNGYKANKNLRFTHAGRKWEIDIVGCKKPLLVCVDCKHWHHGLYPSAIKKIVQEQIQRTYALTESLPKLAKRTGCSSWNTVRLVPVVLSLLKVRFKFHNQVPIVPILQLQDFLNQLPAYVNSLKHFSKELVN